MRVSSEQMQKVISIWEGLPDQERHAFSGKRTRDIELLLAPETELKPQHLLRIRDARDTLEWLFMKHEVVDPHEQILLTRLLILGKDGIFRRFNNIPDPVVLDDLSGNHDDGVGQKNSSDLDYIPSPKLDLRGFPNEAWPQSKRDHAFAKWFNPEWKINSLLTTLEDFPMMSSIAAQLRKELLHEAPAMWKKARSADGTGASAAANRKRLNSSRLCEDFAFTESITTADGRSFILGGAMDGVSMHGQSFSDSICKWLFGHLIMHSLKKNMTEKYVLENGKLDAAQIKIRIENDLLAAQINFRNLLPLLVSSLKLTARKSLSEVDDIGREKNLKTAAEMYGDYEQLMSHLRGDYLLRLSGSTTLELVFIDRQRGQGHHFKVGDGQTYLISNDFDEIEYIGEDNKRSDHVTAAIGPFDSTRKLLNCLQVTTFDWQRGDIVITSTDGFSDNLASILGDGSWFGAEDKLAAVAESHQFPASIRDFLCEKINAARLEKPDDIGFAVMA